MPSIKDLARGSSRGWRHKFVSEQDLGKNPKGRISPDEHKEKCEQNQLTSPAQEEVSSAPESRASSATTGNANETFANASEPFANASRPFANASEPFANVSNISDSVSKTSANVPDSVSKPLAETSVSTAQELGLYPGAGVLRGVLYFIADSCILNGSLESSLIDSKDIKDEFSISSSHLRNCIHRLKERGFIKLVTMSQTRFQSTRIFHIPRAAFDLILLKRASEASSCTIPLADPLAASDVVSSSILSSKNIRTTTTKEDAYENIDITALKDHGFTSSHLVMLKKAYEKDPLSALPVEIIQDSIHALAFDLKYNASKLHHRMGSVPMLVNLLKRGNPYCSVTPAKYLSPKDKAMKEYVEGKAQQLEKALALEEELFAVELALWKKERTDAELEEITAPSIQKGLSVFLEEKQKESALSKYFRENVWPTVKSSSGF